MKSILTFFLVILEVFSYKKILFKTNIIKPNIYNISNPNTLEHIFPKSLTKKNSNDLHNLFICNGDINNIRSNYKFIDDIDILSNNNWIKLEKNNYVNKKNKLFIPNNESKGIVARAIMYMSYTHGYNYENIINFHNLIKWCITFPPTKEEYNHNNIVYAYQKNRNPFIDLYNKNDYYYLINNTFK